MKWQMIFASALVDDITTKVMMTLLAILSAAAIFGGVFFVIMISSKRQRKKSRGKSALPRHNYARFDRADARDYIKFDDILDVSDEHFGVLVDHHFQRFVCYISLQGFDYNLATKAEQYSSAMGMISVVKTIDSTIQIRQDSRPIDFSDAKNECDHVIEKTKMEIDQIVIKARKLMARINALLDEGDQTAAQDLYLQFQDAKHEVEALNGIIQEQEAIKAQYENRMDITAETNAKKETLYIIDWYYNASEHMNRELSMTERYDEAIQKLWSKSGAYISALAMAGVYARRLSGREILETLRFHTHPYSSAQFKTEDLIRNYSFKNLITTSDFPKTMREEMNKEKERIHKQIEEFYEQVGTYIPEDAPEYIPAK
jgi:hypothetical protein